MKFPSSPPLSKLVADQNIRFVEQSTELAITRFIENYAEKQHRENANSDSEPKVRYLYSDHRALHKLQFVIQQFEEWEDALMSKNVTTHKLSQVTEQEQKIIHCIAKGMQTKEIANSLFISEHTVQTHRKNINKKLGTNSIIDIVKVSMMLILL